MRTIFLRTLATFAFLNLFGANAEAQTQSTESCDAIIQQVAEAYARREMFIDSGSCNLSEAWVFASRKANSIVFYDHGRRMILQNYDGNHWRLANTVPVRPNHNYNPRIEPLRAPHQNEIILHGVDVNRGSNLAQMIFRGLDITWASLVVHDRFPASRGEFAFDPDYRGRLSDLVVKDPHDNIQWIPAHPIRNYREFLNTYEDLVAATNLQQLCSCGGADVFRRLNTISRNRARGENPSQQQSTPAQQSPAQ